MSVMAAVTLILHQIKMCSVKLTEHAMPVVVRVLMRVGVAFMDSPVRQLTQC